MQIVITPHPGNSDIKKEEDIDVISLNVSSRTIRVYPQRLNKGLSSEFAELPGPIKAWGRNNRNVMITATKMKKIIRT